MREGSSTSTDSVLTVELDSVLGLLSSVVNVEVVLGEDVVVSRREVVVVDAVGVELVDVSTGLASTDVASTGLASVVLGASC